MENNIYKVTLATIGTTKNGYKVFRIQLDNSIWATKLCPLRRLDRKYDSLYQLYEEKGGLDFLIGKYISVSITQSAYGYEFSSITSFDALQDFKKELDASKGSSFSTRIAIYNFLKSRRKIEPDGSIKINSEFGDMRLFHGFCCQFDDSGEKLYPSNVYKIFDKFYKDVHLSNSSPGGEKSYYTVRDYTIVEMCHHLSVSSKMSFSGDRDEWVAHSVLRVGDKLTDEQIKFLKSQ